MGVYIPNMDMPKSCGECGEVWCEHWHYSWNLPYESYKSPDCPLIEIDEPKVGEWVERDNGDYYECSACGDAFVLLEGTPYDNYYNYCPNCGAKMRKESR